MADTSKAQLTDSRSPQAGRHGLLALGGGALLAVMISLNSLLAQHSSPWFASWAAHGIGALAVVGLVALLRGFGANPGRSAGTGEMPPVWAYLGGLPGAMTVVLAAVTVNSPIGLSGTLALGLVGQVLFGLLADRFGFFGLTRRSLSGRDVLVALLVLAGSGLLILGKV